MRVGVLGTKCTHIKLRLNQCVHDVTSFQYAFTLYLKTPALERCEQKPCEMCDADLLYDAAQLICLLEYGYIKVVTLIHFSYTIL